MAEDNNIARSSWAGCTLCRAGRVGADTLRRARERRVKWPEPNHSLRDPLEEAVVYTTFEDAFASVVHFMNISSRKCKRYHCSNKPHLHCSPEDTHCTRYHSPNYVSPVISNPLQRPAEVQVVGAPGVYSVTSARWETSSSRDKLKGTHTTHVVQLEPGQAVNLTFSV